MQKIIRKCSILISWVNQENDHTFTETSINRFTAVCWYFLWSTKTCCNGDKQLCCWLFPPLLSSCLLLFLYIIIEKLINEASWELSWLNNYKLKLEKQIWNFLFNMSLGLMCSNYSNIIPFILHTLEICSILFNPATNFSGLILIKLC